MSDSFVYLGSTMTSDLSPDKELDRWIGRAYGIFAQLAKKVWENSNLTIKTKMAVYRACILSTLLYGNSNKTLCFVRHPREMFENVPLKIS